MQWAQMTMGTLSIIIKRPEIVVLIVQDDICEILRLWHSKNASDLSAQEYDSLSRPRIYACISVLPPPRTGGLRPLPLPCRVRNGKAPDNAVSCHVSAWGRVDASRAAILHADNQTLVTDHTDQARKNHSFVLPWTCKWSMKVLGNVRRLEGGLDGLK